MRKIYSICNQKGGCGKTMTSVSIGIGLARQGRRVLLVDMDAQGSLTASLGYIQPDQMEVTLATIMEKIMDGRPLLPGEGILHHSESIDLLPANIELSGVEVTLVNAMSRETIFREYIKTVKDTYDAVILDCMNISRSGSHQYAFEIQQCMNEIRLPFAMRHDTQSGASVSMTRAYACAEAHH